jgi:hypothetical protein
MMKTPHVFLIVPVLAAGCFYPPEQKPLPAKSTEVTLAIPYDLGWDAVHVVINKNNFRIITENPDTGMLEAEAPGSFTLNDADCGKLKGIASKYAAEPDPDSSAVYDFHVKPKGNEATTVEVQATFSAPLHVPLHPLRGEQCVSRGTQEARLLREISLQARNEHRPNFKPELTPFPARETVE